MTTDFYDSNRAWVLIVCLLAIGALCAFLAVTP